MSHYYTRLCLTHGEWEDDVDNPSDCPSCEKEGITPSQLQAKRLAELERENTELREKLAAEDAMGRENKAGSTSTDAEILASDLKSRSLPNNPAPIATVLDKISRFCADKEGNLLLHETGYLVLWDDYAALREKLAAAELRAHQQWRRAETYWEEMKVVIRERDAALAAGKVEK